LSVVNSPPVSTSHSFAVLSQLAEASVRPLGEKTTDMTSAV